MPLDKTTEWPTGPYLIPAMTPRTGGVDFLGLRQVNLELTTACLPGINNTTKLVRPFSVLAWIHWRFHQALEESSRRRAAHADIRAFQDKAELLFTWGHQRQNFVGIPGLKTPPPAAQPGGWVDLSFKSWDRTARNTSLQAPVQYGPAMKEGYGLGFLESVESSLFRVTPAGKDLALSLDRRLEKSEAYPLLISLDRNKGKPADADALLKAWHASQPSEPEAKIFRNALFDPTKIESTDILGRRSAMIFAILKVLRRSKRGLSEEEIRFALVWHRLPKGQAISLSGGPARVTLHWKILQIRQAQRVALESLLTWFEDKLKSNESSLEAIHSRLREALDKDAFSRGGKGTCAAALAKFCRPFSSEADYLSKCAHGHESDVLTITLTLLNTEREPADTIPEITALLVGVVAWFRWIAQDETHREFLTLGGVERVSLWHLNESFQRFADRPISEWMEDLVERWIIGQHLRVATLRSDGGTQRLRFGFGETGLEFYADKPSAPNLTQDHLAAVLSLMDNCGLIHFATDTSTYSVS